MEKHRIKELDWLIIDAKTKLEESRKAIYNQHLDSCVEKILDALCMIRSELIKENRNG